ncbi:MAG: hypothetical protein J0L94_08940 [Rhodothermia bacterium]|mgnify:CR=1 FL=1|nr:hypothetical protein [Rhodothermia bacterium]
MKKRFFATFAFLLLTNTSTTWAQKAYDKVLYTGKTQNITLLLTFAHGYNEASEIKTTDNKTKKTSKFLPSPNGQAENGEMHFDHISVSGKKMSDHIVVKGLDDAAITAPSSVSGYYFFKGKKYTFTLKKRE